MTTTAAHDNSTQQRRRDFLLLTAAVATTVMAARPALASPTAQDYAVDPVFELIARHRAEQQAYGDALIARDELHEIVPAEVLRSPRVQWGMKDGEPYYLHSHQEIDHRLEWVPDFAATPKIRARLHDELDRDITEWRAKRDEHGVTPAELLVDRLCHSCHELAWAIATTAPTSMAGVAAVLRYVNEEEDAGGEWPGTDTIGSEGWHYRLRQTVALALEACA